MSEWLDSMPWGKIGAGVGSALLVVAGGWITKDKVDNKLEDARAPMTTQQAHMLEHFDWQTSCEVVAANVEEGIESRKCASDGCIMTVVTRNGLRSVFFAIAPREVPRAPIIIGESPAFDLFGGVAHAAAPYTCVYDHGVPSGDPPFIDGEDLGNGWIAQYLLWRDGCRMSRQFHRPSQSATAWAWDRCADAHF